MPACCGIPVPSRHHPASPVPARRPVLSVRGGGGGGVHWRRLSRLLPNQVLLCGVSTGPLAGWSQARVQEGGWADVVAYHGNHGGLSSAPCCYVRIIMYHHCRFATKPSLPSVLSLFEDPCDSLVSAAPTLTQIAEAAAGASLEVKAKVAAAVGAKEIAAGTAVFGTNLEPSTRIPEQARRTCCVCG